jgi:hypothetical protein
MKRKQGNYGEPATFTVQAKNIGKILGRFLLKLGYSEAQCVPERTLEQ